MSRKQAVDPSQWIMLINEKHLEDKNGENKPEFCKLRHPKTDKAAMFLFSQGDKVISEVTQYKEDYGSWFINQTVQQDGSLYVTTAVNPAYLILPYLIREEKGGKYKPLDQVLMDEDYPECNRLCQCESLRTLHQMCDVKGPEDLRAYKYNKDKTLTWLKKKVMSLCRGLEKRNVVMSGSRAATYVQSTKSQSNQEDELRYAHGLLSEYLPESLSLELKQLMGIKDAVVHEKPAIDEPKSKRAKTDKVSPMEDYSDGNKAKSTGTPASKLSAAQRQLSKVDRSGMKSIASFFSPKQAKSK